MTIFMSGPLCPIDQPTARIAGPARGSRRPTDGAASAPGRSTPTIAYDLSNEGARQCRST
jgi:hypothetical protein